MSDCANFKYYSDEDDGGGFRLQHGDNPEHSYLYRWGKGPIEIVQWHEEIVRRYGTGLCLNAAQLKAMETT